MMIKLKLIIPITIIALIFSACDSEEANKSSGLENKIISCSATTNIPDGYTSLSSGNTIVKDSNVTQISIFHASDGTKKVCVSSGSASIN